MKYVIKVNTNRGRFFVFNSVPVICGSFFEFRLHIVFYILTNNQIDNMRCATIHIVSNCIFIASNILWKVLVVVMTVQHLHFLFLQGVTEKNYVIVCST